MKLKAVLFDLHDTLVYLESRLNSEEASDFLLKHGYRVYPQSWDAASHYVAMVDYPKHGYSDGQALLKQILRRLDVEVDDDTLKKLAQLYDCRNHYSLFSDAAPAVRKAKQLGLKTKPSSKNGKQKDETLSCFTRSIHILSSHYELQAL